MSTDASARGGLIRQGDLLLVPVDEVPADARRLSSGRLVLAEGEATGHAHVIDDERASLHTGWDSVVMRHLRVEGDEPVLLVHEEHDSLRVPPGVYRVVQQREYQPSRVRWRWVAD